ncbi:hypothetical protein [Fibrobacter sp. UWH4]|uniref:hypothetical protein n=1 Tax=Fibrobacter sp. UWH4 TaxID=1896210 RepID=UPI00091193F7|nr:hypothetical protein [Fibrobacter sp. UWH4]SHL05535.1 hypothetical protein SAMN05720762_10472 [Fibrobacter sp. UWH4]
MSNEKLFLVFAHWEPLGIMTMLDAFRWSWSQGAGHHVIIEFTPVNEKEKSNG